LTRYFSGLQKLRISFSEARRFAGVLYLAPAPDAPLRDMTRGLVDLFPEAPPYGEKYADIVPHLTVAQADDKRQLEAIAAKFRRAAERRLPIRADLDEVTLIEKVGSKWKPKMSFSLGRTPKNG